MGSKSARVHSVSVTLDLWITVLLGRSTILRSIVQYDSLQSIRSIRMINAIMCRTLSGKE